VARGGTDVVAARKSAPAGGKSNGDAKSSPLRKRLGNGEGGKSPGRGGRGGKGGGSLLFQGKRQVGGPLKDKQSSEGMGKGSSPSFGGAAGCRPGRGYCEVGRSTEDAFETEKESESETRRKKERKNPPREDQKRGGEVSALPGRMCVRISFGHTNLQGATTKKKTNALPRGKGEQNSGKIGSSSYQKFSY